MLLDRSIALSALVERRIQEAIDRGEFDNLPGQGKPLDLDDDRMVPFELRVAHRILKNSGYVPPEAAELSEINQLIAAATRDGDESGGLSRRLRAMLAKLEASGRNLTASRAWHDYEKAIVERVVK